MTGSWPYKSAPDAKIREWTAERDALLLQLEVVEGLIQKAWGAIA